MDENSRLLYGAAFVDLADTKQVELLSLMEQGRAPKEAWKQSSSTKFFGLLVDHTMKGFYGDPRHGGNRDGVSWKMLGVPDPPIRGRLHYDGRRDRPPTARSVMALNHVNAVVIGAGAGGGIVAKELSTAGLSVVLLERGKWYTACDCRKDDLRNQRTTVLGNAFGPNDERNPRVLVDRRPGASWSTRATAPTANNAACVGGGTLSYGAMAWRYMPQDFRMRSTYGAVEGSTLEDWPITYDDLEPLLRKGRVGDRRLGRRLERTLSRRRAASRCPCRRCRRTASTRSSKPAAQRWACTRSTSRCCATAFPTTAARPACAAAGAWASPARWTRRTARRTP